MMNDFHYRPDEINIPEYYFAEGHLKKFQDELKDKHKLNDFISDLIDSNGTGNFFLAMVLFVRRLDIAQLFDISRHYLNDSREIMYNLITGWRNNPANEISKLSHTSSKDLLGKLINKFHNGSTYKDSKLFDSVLKCDLYNYIYKWPDHGLFIVWAFGSFISRMTVAEYLYIIGMSGDALILSRRNTDEHLIRQCIGYDDLTRGAKDNFDLCSDFLSTIPISEFQVLSRAKELFQKYCHQAFFKSVEKSELVHQSTPV